MNRGGRPRRTDERYVDAKGYVQVRVGDVYVPEHQLVMMAMLGRDLVPGERVQHRDRVRDHNDPANLQLRVGSAILGEDATELACPRCGLPWLEARPTAIQVPVDEVARRILDGTWSAIDHDAVSGVSGPFGKPQGVPVRVLGHRRHGPRHVIAGQASLFEEAA